MVLFGLTFSLFLVFDTYCSQHVQKIAKLNLNSLLHQLCIMVADSHYVVIVAKIKNISKRYLLDAGMALET